MALKTLPSSVAASFPGLTMALTLFSLNFLGDGLRDALDPQTRIF
jgi:ABC-type dipeptide/oligopeptide/nickel transport system permease subunit